MCGSLDIKVIAQTLYNLHIDGMNNCTGPGCNWQRMSELGFLNITGNGNSEISGAKVFVSPRANINFSIYIKKEVMNKKIFFILVILSIGHSINARDFRKANTYKCLGDTMQLPQVLALPLLNYIGKPVDSLLQVLPNVYTKRGFMPVGIGYTRGIFQSYFGGEFNNFYVEIYIDSFLYLPIPNRTSTVNWNMDLAKQETISFIKVVKNNVCVYGCGNPNYDY